jgi:thiamine biosynthesis lipoprotein ApbE
MKKFFVALMAVLVLAGCGAQKEEKKTASEVMMMTVEMVNSTTEMLEKAETADEVVEAMSVMVNEMKELQNKYGDVLAEIQEMNEEEMLEKYADEVAAVEEAATRFYEVLVVKEQEIEMTPEAQEKMMQVLRSASEL